MEHEGLLGCPAIRTYTVWWTDELLAVSEGISSHQQFISTNITGTVRSVTLQSAEDSKPRWALDYLKGTYIIYEIYLQSFMKFPPHKLNLILESRSNHYFIYIIISSGNFESFIIKNMSKSYSNVHF